MVGRRDDIWIRLVVTFVLACFAPLICSAAAEAAATPGLVKVQGTTVASSTEFNLNDIGSPSQSVPGQGTTKGWPLRKVLLYAQERTSGAFDINNFDAAVEVSRPGSVGNLKVNQSQVASKSHDGKLPIYFLNSGGETSMWQPGGQVWVFADYDPEVFIPSSSSTLQVEVTPSGPLSLKAGDSQSFKIMVANTGSSKVKLSWNINGPVSKSGTVSSGNQFSFTFPKAGSYQVAVFADATSRTQGYKLVKVTVGKAKKKPKKEKPRDQDDSNEDDSSTYDPGYVPGDYYYDDGSGPGTGSPSTGSPSPLSPEPDEKKQDQPVADDSGQTVTGQLIDPTTTATVIPTTDTPATGEPEAGAAEPESKGGGGIPDGAKAALGIGALLGLGGLTEAGAFTGAFRRLRLRP
ncbi:MAG: hypothetical protein J0H66_02350 [Solirubrobacterales bacterium]|nr:hypothetical protein [Solirubrobacterales bacterium]OJU95320.1 MAG: hypothetical protein BGO23_05525 [Solirubrobacterales bacterium 67-14]